MNELLINLGARIRDIRKSQGLSQEVLAEKSDTTPHYIGQIERAQTNVSINTLQKIALALGVNINDFFSFLPPAKILTKKDQLISEIISLVKNEDEEKVKITYGILKDILKWINSL